MAAAACAESSGSESDTPDQSQKRGRFTPYSTELLSPELPADRDKETMRSVLAYYAKTAPDKHGLDTIH